MSSKKINDLEEQYWSGQLSEDDEQLRVTTVQTLQAEREAREEKRILRRQKKLRQGIIRVLAVCVLIAVVVGGIYLYQRLMKKPDLGNTKSDIGNIISAVKDESGYAHMVYDDGQVVPLGQNVSSALANKNNDIIVFVKESGEGYFMRKDGEEDPILIDMNAINGAALTENVILSMRQKSRTDETIIMKLLDVSDQSVIYEGEMNGIDTYLLSPNKRWLAMSVYDQEGTENQCYLFDLKEKKRYTQSMAYGEAKSLWMVRDNGEAIWTMHDPTTPESTMVLTSPESDAPLETLNLGKSYNIQVMFSADQQTMLVVENYESTPDVWIVDKNWDSVHVTLPFEVNWFETDECNVLTNAGWFTEANTKDIEELYFTSDGAEYILQAKAPNLQCEDGGFFGMAAVSMKGDINPVCTENKARFRILLGNHILYKNGNGVLCEGEIKDHTLQLIRELDGAPTNSIYSVRDEFLLYDDDTEVYTELDPYEPYKRKTLFIDIDNGKEYELGPVYQILPTEKGSNLWYLTYTGDMTYNLMEFDLSTHNVILHDTNIHALTWWYGGNIEDLQSTSFNYYKEVMQDRDGKTKLELYHYDGEKSTKLLSNIWEDGLYF